MKQLKEVCINNHLTNTGSFGSDACFSALCNAINQLR